MGTCRFWLIQALLGAVLFSVPAGAVEGECERRVLREFVPREFGETSSGFYLFNDHGVPTWAGDDGVVSSQIRRGAYLTGDASHLAILRRQVGEARFREIMLSRDPELAARAAIEADIRLAYNALPADLVELQIRLRGAIAQIKLDEEIPETLMRLVYAVLERMSLFHRQGIDGFLRANASLLTFENLLSGVNYKVMDLPVITGNVEAWRAGAEGQTTTLRMISLERSVDGLGYSSLSLVLYHMNFVELLQAIFGPARVLHTRGDRDPGSISEYFQSSFDARGERGRGIQYTPLYLSLEVRGGGLDYFLTDRSGNLRANDERGSLPVAQLFPDEAWYLAALPTEEAGAEAGTTAGTARAREAAELRTEAAAQARDRLRSGRGRGPGNVDED